MSVIYRRSEALIRQADSTEKTMTIRMLMIAQNELIAFDFRCYFCEMMIKFIQQDHSQSLPIIKASRGVIAGKKNR
ncbi:hypothetical protein AAGR22_10500 [Erwinia sp. HDF1-3R]|uniref:hypothetical protein n=1 Tax=Erwinia sp. HDF1-3R TaxID=3141543 RepID=UPI0031F5104C